MKTIYHPILFVLTLGLATSLGSAATKSWQGSFISFVWSDPGNWDPAGVPQDGDDLRFHGTAIVSHFGLMINDLTNFVARSLRFTANAIPEIDWTLNGNTLTVTETINTTDTDDTEVDINCGVRLGGHAWFEAARGPDLIGDAALHLNGPIDLNGFNLTLVEGPDLFGSADLDVAGPISGNGNIIVNAPDASVELKGDVGNTFVGTVTVIGSFDVDADGSELILNKSLGLAVPGGLIIGTNCVVNLDQPHQIADTATVVIAPGGLLRLDGHTETISGLSLREAPIPHRARDLRVDTGGATLSVTDNITALNSHATVIPTIQGQLGLAAGSHAIHTSGSSDLALNIEARIVGEGGITKQGDKGLRLSGDSSFGGDAVLREGRVHVNHANALGSPSGATILDGGELYLNGVSVGIETLLVERNAVTIPELGAILNALDVCSWAGPVVLNTNLTVTGGAMTFSGVISGPGGLRFLFNDAIQLAGSNPNTYTGDTVSGAALLQLNKPPGVTAFRGRLLVGDGNVAPNEVRWLQDYQCIGADVSLGFDALINLNNHREDFGPVTFSGGAISTGPAGELGIYGLVTVTASSSAATIDGRLGLPPGVHEFRVNDGSSLPDLRINAHVLGAGHLRKTGSGQLWLAASNSYSGVTFIDEGTLSTLNAYALGAATAGTTVSEGATLDLNAITATMPESLALRGTGVNGNGALDVFGLATLRSTFPSIFPAIDLTTNTTINVRGGSLLTVDGFISGVGPLTKAGAGTLLMANANENTYSGDTIIADGTLDLAKPSNVIAIPGNLIVGPAPLNSPVLVRWSQSGALKASSIVTANAGSLLDLNGFFQTITRLNLNDGADVQTGVGALSFIVGGTVNVGSLSLLGSHAGSSISGTIGLPPNAQLTFAVSPFAPTPPFILGPELYVSAAIAAPVENPTFERAGLAKTGAGRVQLLGNNTYRGWTDISEGVVIAGANSALGTAFPGGTYVFNSGMLELQGGITVANENVVLNSTAVPALFSWAGDNIWNGLITLQRDSTIGVGVGNEFRAGGVITGTGHLIKTGAGILVFQGPDHNTYVGETFVNEGPLYLAKPIAVTAVPSVLNIGTPAGLFAAVVNYSSYQIIGNIFINRGGVWNVYGQVENVDHLWLTEGGDVFTESGVLAIKTGGSIQVVPGNVNEPATIEGTVEFLAGAHSINVGASTGATEGPDLNINALLTSAGETITLQKDGPGTARFSANNSYVGTTVVNGGVLRVDGSQAQSPVRVNAAGTLKGSGVVGPITFNGNGGVVAPGGSPGVLACNSFNVASAGTGVLEIELNGPAPGIGYDRLSVGDIPVLSGITLRAKANFVAPTNHEFVIMNNAADIPLQDTFNALPEGATLRLGDQIFQITYAGGDGNEVVLTKLADVFRPTLTIERVAPDSVRLLWPTNDSAFNLQFTTNLNGTNFGDWAFIAEPSRISGTNRVVTNTASGPHKLYRLFKP